MMTPLTVTPYSSQLGGVRVRVQELGSTLELICGIHCMNVAVHLVSEGDPGLLGIVHLRAAQAAPAVALAACRCRGGEAWLRFFTRFFSFCLCRAMSALAFVFAAPVEGEAQEHLHTHSSRGSS